MGVFGAGVAMTPRLICSVVPGDVSWGQQTRKADFREKYKPNAEILRKTYSSIRLGRADPFRSVVLFARSLRQWERLSSHPIR